MSANKEQQLLPAYLVLGDDALKRDTVMRRLRARIEALGDIAFNADVFRSEELVGSEVVSACLTMPFMSDMRLVEVVDIELLKTSEANVIADYLKEPCDTCVLALVGEKLAKNTRLYKAVAAFGSSAVIECPLPKEKDLPGRVRDMALAHGVPFTLSAASKLAALVGSDTVRLDSEIAKIALAHEGGDYVTDKEVERMVSCSTEPKPWELVDAFSERNIARFFEIYGRLKSPSPRSLMPQVTRRVRELIAYKALERRGEIGLFSTEIKLPANQKWKQKLYQQWSRRYTSLELREALCGLREAELAMNSGRDDEDCFVSWVMKTMAK